MKTTSIKQHETADWIPESMLIAETSECVLIDA